MIVHILHSDDMFEYDLAANSWTTVILMRK